MVGKTLFSRFAVVFATVAAAYAALSPTVAIGASLTNAPLAIRQVFDPEIRNLITPGPKAESMTLVDAVNQLKKAQISHNTKSIVSAYSTVGLCLYRLQEYDKAAEMYRNALNICDSVGDLKGVATYCHNLANTLAMQNLYNEANEYDHKALSIFYSLNNEEAISKICKTLGLMCINHRLYKTASEYLTQALEIDNRMNIRTNDHINDIAYDYLYLGRADLNKFQDTRNDSLLRQGKIKTRRAYSMFKKSGDDTDITNACKSLMDTYLKCAQRSSGHIKQKYLDSSRAFHDQGLTLLLRNDQPSIGLFEFRIWEARYAIENKQFNKAQRKLDEIGAAIGSDTLHPYLVDYGFTRATYYEAIGDFKQAYEWSNKTSKIERRQLNREFAVKSAKLSLKSEIDDIMQQRELAKEQEYIVRREQEIRLVVSTASTSFVLIMIVVLTIIIYKSLKRNKRLGKKLKERNEELESQRDQMEIINDQIASSINFAHHLQTSMLPSEKQIADLLGDAIILWRPLDLVSGDFYWATRSGSRKLVTIADCTGHGVPGGFMSMLGVSILSDITQMPVFKDGSMTAGQLLDLMRSNVVESLRQSEDGAMALDGMDMAVCIIDEDSSSIQFAGAFRPMIAIRNGKLTEYKGDRMPISYLSPNPRPFETIKIDVEPGDTFFIYSDGITDQFGYNEKGDQSKFSGRRLQRVLIENCEKPLNEQKSAIENAIDNWRSPSSKRTLAQTDDIILMGFRISKK